MATVPTSTAKAATPKPVAATAVAGGGLNVTKAAAAPAAPPKPVGPPFQIHSLGQYNRWLKLLGYGAYGSGKTRLMGSAAEVPQMRDVLFIDCEAGDLTIATEDDKSYASSAAAYIDVIRVTSFRELARVQEYLKVHCMYRDQGDVVALKALEKKLWPEDQYDPDKPARMYRTAIVDSLSEAETFSMYSILGITDKTRLDDDVASAEWAEFKRNHSQIQRCIRGFRDLPMHILMTAAAAYVQDDQKRMLWQPALTGKLAKQCQGFMDIVGFMYVTQGEQGKKIHNLQVQPTPRIDAKCRFSNFKANGWADATLLKILTDVHLIDSTTMAKKATPVSAPAVVAAPSTDELA